MKLHIPLRLRAILFAILVSSTSEVGFSKNIENETYDLTSRVSLSNEEWFVVNSNFSAKGLMGSTNRGNGPAINANNSEVWFLKNPSVLFDSNCAGYTNQNGIFSGNGGAIYLGSVTVTQGNCVFEENEKVKFVSNKTAHGGGSGGAIYSSSPIAFTKNGEVLFESNRANNGDGGAVYAYSYLKFDGNENVAFTSNASERNGGALYTYNCIIRDTDSAVLFQDNSAGDSGGAIRTAKGSLDDVFQLNDNVSVSFIGNYVTNDNSAGGALFLSGNTCNEIKANGDVIFKTNTAQGSGGAVHLAPLTAELVLSHNSDISFEGNVAKNGQGGAVRIDQSSLSITNNTSVTFCGNSASTAGGAISIDSGRLTIADNAGDVTFAGNSVRLYDDEGNLSSIRLNSISSSSADIILAAKKGTTIGIYDGLQAAGIRTSKLNAYTPQGEDTSVYTSGDILFSGKDSEVKLKKLWQENGLSVSGEAFAKALEASRTFEIQTQINATTLYGGRLRVEDGAVFKGNGFVAAADTDAVLMLKDASLAHAGSNLRFGKQTGLTVLGVNSVSGNLVMEADSIISFGVGVSNLSSPILTHTGSFTLDGALTVSLTSEEVLTPGASYKLLTLTDIAAPDEKVWNKELITVNGLELSFDNLVWRGATLYLDIADMPELTTATWNNTSGNMTWDAVSENWRQMTMTTAFKDGVSVIFGDTESGEVSLVGELIPNNVQVNNSKGKDYSFVGSGYLSGEKTKLTKKGEGTLSIATANSYGGGTVIEGGKVVTEHELALGTGSVVLNNGELDMNNKPLRNTLLANGGVISHGSRYCGSVTFSGSVGVKGNLSAEQAHITQGSVITLSEGSISVSGSLTLGGAAVVQLGGSSFGDGSVLITFGNLIGSEELLTLNYGAESDKYSIVREGNSLILSLQESDLPEDTPLPGPTPEEPALAFDRELCDALVQSSWGAFTASHAFADALGGQRSAAGYVGGGRSTAWVSVLGGFHSIDGSAGCSGSDIDLFGAAVGLEHFVTDSASLGFAVGHVRGDVQMKSGGRDVDQEGTYAGVYGNHLLAGFNRNNWLSLNWSAIYGDTTTDALVGQEEMSWKQDSVQLNARVAWTTQLDHAWSLNVFGGMEYFASNSAENEASDFLRSDVADSERVRMGSIQNLRGEFGVGTSYTNGFTTVYGEVRYLNDMVRSNPYADINGIRGYGANPGRHGVGVTIGAQQTLSGGWSVSASYSLEAMNEATMHSANIGMGYKF